MNGLIIGLQGYYQVLDITEVFFSLVALGLLGVALSILTKKTCLVSESFGIAVWTFHFGFLAPDPQKYADLWIWIQGALLLLNY